MNKNETVNSKKKKKNIKKTNVVHSLRDISVKLETKLTKRKGETIYLNPAKNEKLR